MNLKNYIVQRNINDSINEKHNTSYKDNIETSRASIQLNEDKYDEENKTEKYFFNNIIFFTNERNSKKNKTLKNLESAIKGTNINLITFVAEEVEYKADDNKIEIHDQKTDYVIDKQSNVDTIAIVRLGAQDSEECMECIKEIQDWGIFTLNPIMAAKRASTKYS